MGSMLKFDSERRELVRERRQARVARKRDRRQARQDKRSVTIHAARVDAPAIAETPVTPAAATISPPAAPAAATISPAAAPVVVDRPRATGEPGGGRARTRPAATPDTRAGMSRRERDIAAFKHRRQQAADMARMEARERIARAGAPVSVADALAALAMPEAAAWASHRAAVDRALDRGRIGDTGTAARRALWAITRDAARTSRRARCDPELALAVCVAYAILAVAPQTAVASVQRTRCPARAHGRPRGFWR